MAEDSSPLSEHRRASISVDLSGIIRLEPSNKSKRGKVVLRPHSYEDALALVEKHFGLKRDEICLQTNELAICHGELLEVTHEVWDVIADQLSCIYFEHNPINDTSNDARSQSDIIVTLEEPSEEPPSWSSIATVASHDPMTIFVQTSGSRILQCDTLSPSNTIHELKLWIYHMLGHPIRVQNIVHRNRVLQDTHSLHNCNVFLGDTVNLVIRWCSESALTGNHHCRADSTVSPTIRSTGCRPPFSVSVKTARGGCFVVSGLSSVYSVDHLKNLIRQIGGLPKKQQKLTVHGTVPSDEQSLQASQIVAGDELTLTVRRVAVSGQDGFVSAFNVFIKRPHEESPFLTLENMHSIYTVGSLKSIINQHLGTASHQLRLCLASGSTGELEDSHTLYHYGVRSPTIFHLLPISPSTL